MLTKDGDSGDSEGRLKPTELGHGVYSGILSTHFRIRLMRTIRRFYVPFFSFLPLLLSMFLYAVT